MLCLSSDDCTDVEQIKLMREVSSVANCAETRCEADEAMVVCAVVDSTCVLVGGVVCCVFARTWAYVCRWRLCTATVGE